MPTYTYECKDGHVTEDMRRVAHRGDPATCETCGQPATLVILQAAEIDWYKMGCDPGFPSAWDKWAKAQTAKNTGKQWDSNNRRYGGDWEKKK